MRAVSRAVGIVGWPVRAVSRAIRVRGGLGAGGGRLVLGLDVRREARDGRRIPQARRTRVRLDVARAARAAGWLVVLRVSVG
jgi:hypothetical protein